MCTIKAIRLTRNILMLGILLGLSVALTGCENFIFVCPEFCTYTSIQAAIAAANPGDTVSLVNISLTPEKVWLENLTFYENIVIDKPLTLQFEGFLSAPLTFLQAAEPSKPTITIASKGVRILKGNITGWHVGVLVREGAEVEIEGAHIESLDPESDFTGVLVEPGARAILSRNTIVGSRWGVKIEAGASQPVIKHNLFINNIEGVYLKAPALVQENTFIDGGITLELEGPQGAVIQRNTFLRGSLGISVKKGQAQILENMIHDNRNGIWIEGPSELKISRNMILRNGRFGVALTVGDCFSFLSFPRSLDVQLSGQENLIADNGRKDPLGIQDYGGDLCPSDFPWPPGFKK